MLFNQLKTIFLLGTLSVVLVGIGGALGPGWLYGFLALAILINFGSYFFSDKIVLRMNNAQEVTPQEAPRLHRMIEELSEKAGIPKPKVCVIPADYANAFATGRNPKNGVVAVTEGIMRVLSERELRGVIAHEIAHIKNRDVLISTIAAAMATALSYIANAFMFSSMFGGGNSEEGEEGGGSGIGGLLLMFIAPLAGTLIQLAISRSREYIADETAAQLTGDPESLALALERLSRDAEVNVAAAQQAQPATASLCIVNPLTGGGFASLFSTHPPMEERIRLLRAMEYTRTTGRMAA